MGPRWRDDSRIDGRELHQRVHVLVARQRAGVSARPITGGTTFATTGAVNVLAPRWVRLDRAGDTFTLVTRQTCVKHGRSQNRTAAEPWWGLAAVSGQPDVAIARAFPPTRFGIWAGVKYEQWFKSYARDSMVPHVYRFQAYRLTLADIERATRLRNALAAPRNESSDDQVLRAIES